MRNLPASKRGWGYDLSNAALNAYVDGTKGFSLTTSTFTITRATVGANARAFREVYTVATPAMSDGVGIHEIDVTVTGTATGHIAATSTWINLGTDAVIPSYCELYNDGIWDGTATLSSANISWARYHCSLASNPAAVNLWSLNFNGANSELDALFDVNNAELALGFTSGSPSASSVGSIPFFWIAGGAGGGPFYIHLHNNAT